MNNFKQLVPTFLLFLLLTLTHESLAQEEQSESIPGQLFVQLSAEYNAQLSKENKNKVESYSFLKEFVGEYGITSFRNPFKLDNPLLKRTYLLEFDKHESTDELIRQLSGLEQVKYAEPVPAYYSFYTPNDPDFSNQWHLQTIDAELAWNAVSTATSNVVIAVVDDAVLLSHEDLQQNIWTNANEIAGDNIDNDNNGYIDDVNGWDAADNDNNPNPDNPTNSFFTHGTHCAGIASGRTDNNLGISSIGFHAQIMPIKSSQLPNPGAVIAGYSGVEYAIINNANVISMSWGGALYSATYQILFDQANAQGIVCVAAAGNSNTNVAMYPANYQYVISVAASDENDLRAGFSNYGSWIDVTAPGVNIFSSLAGSTSAYGGMSGTSMACPMVAGLAALLLAVDPLLTPEEVEDCIESSADDIYPLNPSYVGQLGAGRINAANAVLCVSQVLARFESDYQFACPSESIQFTDISGGTPTSWNWSFPGGTPSTSTAQNPLVTYNTPGVYDVTLTVSDGSNSNTLTTTNYITVAVPEAVLSGSNTIVNGYPGYLMFDFTGNAPWTVTYSDGTNQFIINNINTSPYYHQVNPSATTSYSIVDFSDAGCTGNFSGSAEIEVINAAAFDCYYTKHYGDSLNNNFVETHYDAASDAIFAVGRHNTSQGLFARIGPSGDLTFAVTIDNLGNGYSDIAPAPNGDMLCLGLDNEDIVLSRFSSMGNHLWTKRYDNIRERWINIVESTGDSYIISSAFSTGGSSDDAVFTRVDSNGDIIWSTRFHSIDDQPYDLISDGAGGAYFSGGVHGGGSVDLYVGHIDVNGNFGTVAEYNIANYTVNEAFSLVRASNGDFILSSRVSALNSFPTDGHIMRLDANFNLIWERVFTGVAGTRINAFDDLVEDKDGYLYLSCRYDTPTEAAVILKFSPQGDFIWSKEIVDTRALKIRNTNDPSEDNLILSRLYDGVNFGSNDAFISRTDTSLNSCNAQPIQTSFLSGTSTRSILPMTVSSMSYTVTLESPNFEPLFYETGIICEDCPQDTTCTGALNPMFDEEDMICLGDTVFFEDQSTANSGVISSWIWDFGDGNFAYNNPNVSHVYQSTGLYTVTLTIGNDSVPYCTDSISMSIEVVDELSLNMPDDFEICVGDSVALDQVQFLCGTAFGWDFQWSPSIGLSDPTAMTPNASPASTITYTLLSTNGTDTLTGAVTISVDQNCCGTVAGFEPNKTWCQGESIQLSNTSVTTGAASFSWSFGSEATPSSHEGMNPPPIIYQESGTYSVELIINDDCGSDTLIREIVVLGLPVFNPGENQEICEPQLVSLGDTAVSWYNYDWDPGELVSDSSISNPTAYIETDTEFVLEVVDNWTGCSNTLSVMITVECDCQILEIPNVFTPNGDLSNETFYPIVDGECEDRITMVILNRWGNLMFTSEDTGSLKWNGSTPAGLEANEGVYFYLIQLDDETYHGHVTLVR